MSQDVALGGKAFYLFNLLLGGVWGPFLRELLILEELRVTSRCWACEGAGWEMGGGRMASEATHGLSPVLLGTLPESLGLRE